MKEKKRLILSIGLVMSIAIIFWLGSRYPQLNEKAMMGEDAPMMGLSFDQPFDIQTYTPLVTKILYNTLNWMETNRKGMIFGVLFAGALMVIFSLLKNKQFENRWLNTLFGVIIGAPLGVCVNCAAPIAKGMKDSGSRSETALATMISSPTLNLVVITMLFSLFPLYLVLIKLAATFLLLFLVIPLLTKFLASQNALVGASDSLTNKVQPNASIEPVLQVDGEQNWFSALKWTFQSFFHYLWFIIKTAVPLMILAGLLGNILITLIPLNELISILPTDYGFIWNKRILPFMLGVALFGALLPVPMTFDVIISFVLWSFGLPIYYVAILLFTLGSYSIYPYFIVHKSFAPKMAMGLMLAVIGFGVVSGIGADFWNKYEKKQELTIMISQLKKFDGKLKTFNSPSYTFENLPNTAIGSLMENAVEFKPFIQSDDHDILVKSFEDKSERPSKTLFDKKEGINLGIHSPYEFSARNVISPFTHGRSIASGDIHQDGWPDLAITSSFGIKLFANLQGKNFIEQEFEWPDSLPAMGVALVDLNNDSWLDLFIATYHRGNYIFWNQKGVFDNLNFEKLPRDDEQMLTRSPAFSDVNQDGNLDIFTGNYTVGPNVNNRATLAARNYLLLSNNGEYQRIALAGLPGETLSTLFSDFDLDGDVDLIVGNDHEVPDYFYINESDSFRLVTPKDSLVEHITMNTMSLITVDIDNDLQPEILQASTSNSDLRVDKDYISPCMDIENTEHRILCQDMLKYQFELVKAARKRSINDCPDEYKLDCLIARARFLKVIGRHRTEESLFQQYFPPSLPQISDMLHFNQYKDLPFDKKQGYPQFEPGFALFKRNGDRFKDVMDSSGITNAGWAWNSKAADLDNDGWQDLFVSSSFLLNSHFDRNSFYQNKQGKGFQDRSSESGLDSYLPTTSYTYVDYDLDGDLDIITGPCVGPVMVYENTNQDNNSIMIELNDLTGGNFYGINTKVTIYYGDGLHQIKELLASGGFMSFDAPILHFGLGQYEEVKEMVVDWPDKGQTTINGPLKANAYYKVKRKS